MTLTVVRHDDPAALLRRARPFLLRDEPETSLILGVAQNLAPDRPGPLLLTVERDDEVRAVALHIAPHSLLVTDVAPEDRAALRTTLLELVPDLPSMTGPMATVDALRTGWPQAHATVHMRLHKLERLIEPPVPPGQVRLATPADADALAPWAQGFTKDSGSDDPRPGAEVLAPYLDNGTLYLWEDGQARCMVGWSRDTPNGASISLVYTPPAHRGRGYATALAAHVSRLLLSRGKRFCVLFTNLANPTANAIYARIGYEPLSDHSTWSLRAP
ncbi:MAG: GNAT family N-acetyltransferase [Myxococcota bacterium]